jgi:thioredoxin family protein/AhpC/TSA family protein
VFPRPRIVLVLAAALAVVIVSIVVFIARFQRPEGEEQPPALAPGAERVPALEAASMWLNGGPITPDSLRGRATVLVLWSDTDPRCVKALPEVEAWHQAFWRYGLRVVGVYAPDFSFGADSTVPARAARRLRLTFPIALDPGYRIAFGAGAGRPAIAVADTAGRIVLRADGDHLDAADRAIREQLRRARPDVRFPADPEASPAPAAAEPPRFAFLGTARAAAGPLAGVAPGRTVAFTAQFRFQEEGDAFVPFPVGRWRTSAEGLVATRGGAMDYVAIRYAGGRASVVMAPPAGGRTRVWLLEDEGWMSEGSRGDDVRVDRRGATYVDVTEPRLYWIARDRGTHVLKLSPEGPGCAIYSFAFEPGVEAEGSAGSGTPPGRGGRSGP